MKYVDCGFRPLYKNFCIFPLNPVLGEALKDQKGIGEAEGVMVYGYVDHEAGNTLEIVALTMTVDDDRYSFIRLSDEARFFVRMESLMEEEFEFADYGDAHLHEWFKNKINPLALYDVSTTVAKSRDLTFLDEFRYEKNFDDVQVILYKEGYKLEGVWARIEALDQGVIMGTLLSEPEQDLGVNAGSPIGFVVNEGKDKQKMLVADLTPRPKYTVEELADGKILKKALTNFNEDKNKFKLFAVLELLRDSTVVVPFTQKGVDILTSKNKSFYPAFSDSIEMWEYDDKIIKTNMTFLEVIKKAKSNKKLEGIVVNAFSDAFVIPKSMFELVEGLESRIK